MKSSMMKLRVFSYPHIFAYSSVLFVDADFLFNLEDLESIFTLVFKAPGKLHVSREPYAVEHFNDEPFGLDKLPVSNEEIEKYRLQNFTPFNAGIFLFQPNQEMKTHFDNVISLIKSYSGKFYYEQSFLNYYFPRHNAMEFSITTRLAVSGVMYDLKGNFSTLIHFTRVYSMPKAAYMQLYVQKNMPWMERILNSLNETNVLAASSSSCLSYLPWVHRDDALKTTDCVVLNYLMRKHHHNHQHNISESTNGKKTFCI